MKNNNRSANDPLRELMAHWKVETPLPPRFQQAVWERIAARSRSTTASLWSILCLWLEDGFRRPAWAVSFAALFLMAGLAFGLWRGYETTRDMDRDLARRYVQMVDPYPAQNPGSP